MDTSIAILGKGQIGNIILGGVGVPSHIEVTPSLDFTQFFDETFAEREVIINCVGMTDRKECQKYPEKADFINYILPKELGKWCQTHYKKFVHISTACLYPRGKTIHFYDEDYPTSRKYTDVYLESKARADKVLLSSSTNHLILRPRLVCSFYQHRSNFLYKLNGYNILSNALQNISCGNLIQLAVEKLINQNACGIFNVVHEEPISPEEIGLMMGLNKMSYEDHEYGMVSCEKLKQYIDVPDVRDSLEKTINMFDINHKYKYP
jgi:dTDP-4-dehydrorhamnose reductase